VISRVFDHTARGVLILSLIGMLGLSLLGIVLRWSGLSLMWIDPVVRHLVLVAAFGGGVLAVGKNSHIRIDILSKPMEFAPKKMRIWVSRILTIGTAIATAGLAWSAWHFFLSEKEFGGEALLGLHSSSLVMIFPIGWALLTLRWLSALLDSCTSGEA
jgi:TRAP-type C4-dicarboxylate transport system permease small subunit